MSGAPRPPGGKIEIAGKVVSRIGLGTMRLTGPGTWGPPAKPSEARSILREAVHTYGVTHIDTADAYGPHIAEDLIRRALQPYPDQVLVATKIGMIRPAPNVWVPLGRPQYLRHAVEGSLRRLEVERLDLCYLHRVDPTVPLADQVGVLADMVGEGKISAVGLSKVTPGQIDEAARVIPVAAVQNCLNLDEPTDPALDHCIELGVPYVPYRPLNAGGLAHDGPTTALAWLLDLHPLVAPIPGTSDFGHLRQLVAH